VAAVAEAAGADEGAALQQSMEDYRQPGVPVIPSQRPKL